MTSRCALTFDPHPLSWTDIWVHREALVRFARRKLHDPCLAEDVVHDVFEAVLTGRAVFEGRSQLRSWLTGILRNKIVDLIRQRAVYAEADPGAEHEDPWGHLECPQPRPDEWAEQRQGLRQALDRIERLPRGLRDVMRMRVLQDQPTDEVCQALQISEDNLFVRLHRARKQLMQ